jgi:hypothetical protein
LRGTAVRAGWPDVFVRAQLERSLRDSVWPTIASVPSVKAARATEISGRWNRPGFASAGVTGEDSPHYTNLSTEKKIDRVLVKYFFLSTGNAEDRRKRWQQTELCTRLERRPNAPLCLGSGGVETSSGVQKDLSPQDRNKSSCSGV